MRKEAQGQEKSQKGGAGGGGAFCCLAEKLVERRGKFFSSLSVDLSKVAPS